MNRNSRIIKEYQDMLPCYREVDSIAAEKTESTLKENHFFSMGVLHRVKSEDSVRGKLERYRDRFDSILEMTDIIGLRVICYLSDDIDAIAAALQEIFHVIEVRDKRQKENISEFGYASLHLICSLRPEEGIREELCRIPFEIQIRTVLQHAWAEIEHDLGYKSEYRLSPKLRRTFSRVAGLLEIADGQFSELRTHIGEYRERVSRSIMEDHADDFAIDYISLNRYLLSSRFIRNYWEELCTKHGIEITHAGAENYIEQLAWLDVTTLGGLRELIERNRNLTDCLLARQAEKYELDIFADSAILQLVMDAELITAGYPKNRLINFYALRQLDSEKAERHADWILERKKEYSL